MGGARSLETRSAVVSASSSSSSRTVSHECETEASVELDMADASAEWEEVSVTIGRIWPMIDTRADSTLRTCPLRTMYSIACCGVENCFGRELRKHCIEFKDSNALPVEANKTSIRRSKDSSLLTFHHVNDAQSVNHRGTLFCHMNSHSTT